MLAQGLRRGAMQMLHAAAAYALQMKMRVAGRNDRFMILFSEPDDLFIQLKRIPDFTKLIGKDDIYPIYKEEVLHLLKYSEEHLIKMSKGIIEGDHIIVESGPLKGYEGFIKKIDRHKRLAFIDVELFNTVITVKVGLEIVSKFS